MLHLCTILSWCPYKQIKFIPIKTFTMLKCQSILQKLPLSFPNFKILKLVTYVMIHRSQMNKFEGQVGVCFFIILWPLRLTIFIQHWYNSTFYWTWIISYAVLILHFLLWPEKDVGLICYTLLLALGDLLGMLDFCLFKVVPF